MSWTSTATFVDGGYIPYTARTRDQRLATDRYDEDCGRFEQRGTMRDDLPDRVIYAEAQRAELGANLPKNYQYTGSCVGVSGANAYADAMLGDILHRGDHEQVKPIFAFATYGVGRQVAGMRRPGEGSWGSAQAKACQPAEFGYLPWNHPQVPTPTQQADDGWWYYSKSIELTWSHPSAWPVSRDVLDDVSQQHGIHSATRIQSLDEWQNAIAQGYGVTLASSLGYRTAVKGNVLMGVQDRTWHHQMSCDGYWQHPQYGLLFKIQNQWGPRAHPHCPTLYPLGCTGTFWITSRDAEKHLRGEVYGHSNTGDFPAREFKWTSVATYED